MAKIKNIEIFFLEYPFPKKLNYKYSAGLVENMIVPIIKVTDNENDYGLGEVTHGQFTHKPIIGLVNHFNDLLKGTDIENHANVWPEILSELKKIKVKNYSIYLKEDFMFGYLEYDGVNFDQDMAAMQKIPIVEKWTNLMIDCFNPFPNNEDNNSWVMMDEIFYME